MATSMSAKRRVRRSPGKPFLLLPTKNELMIDNALDLSELGLDEVPAAVFNFQHLEYLYLNGNQISEVPSVFFHKLPNLVFLDLRANSLTSLPDDIGCHRHLETLLLDDNQLRNLPTSLGFLSPLSTVKVSGNPLLYPKIEVLRKGCKHTLSFLRTEHSRPSRELNRARRFVPKLCMDVLREESELLKSKANVGRNSELIHSNSPDHTNYKASPTHKKNKHTFNHDISLLTDKQEIPALHKKDIKFSASGSAKQRKAEREKLQRAEIERKVQQMSTEAVMKDWREEAMQLQHLSQNTKKEYESAATTSPYDVSFDCLQQRSNFKLQKNCQRRKPQSKQHDQYFSRLQQQNKAQLQVEDLLKTLLSREKSTDMLAVAKSDLNKCYNLRAELQKIKNIH